MKFNYYTRITDTTPANSLSLNEVIHIIQSDEYKEQIQTLRSYSKSDFTYTTLKRSLPAFAFNAVFSGTKSTSDVKALTDQMYFDIDHTDLTEDKSIEDIINYLKSLPYISAIWQSCGGKGIGFLAKVENTFNPKDFSTYWTYIKNELNLPLDEACKNINRLTFLTYDKDAYFNTNATAFSFDDALKNNCITIEKNRQLSTTITTPLLLNTGGKYLDLPVSYITQFEMPESKSHLDYIIIPNGVDRSDIWYGKAKSINTGSRNTVLYRNTIKYLYNFPDVDFKALYLRVRANNKIYCAQPMSDKEIESLVKSVYMSHKQGKLIYPVKKKYIQLNYFKLRTREEISKAQSRARGELLKFRNESFPKLVDAYLKLKESGIKKITQKTLINASGLTQRTVERYSKRVKEKVAYLEETGDLSYDFSEHFYYGPLVKFNFHVGKDEGR